MSRDAFERERATHYTIHLNEIRPSRGGVDALSGVIVPPLTHLYVMGLYREFIELYHLEVGLFCSLPPGELCSVGGPFDTFAPAVDKGGPAHSNPAI